MNIHQMFHQESIASHGCISRPLYSFLGWKCRLWGIHFAVYVLHSWRWHHKFVVYNVESMGWANHVGFALDEQSHQPHVIIENAVQMAPIMWEELISNITNSPRNSWIHAMVCIILYHFQIFRLNSHNTENCVMSEYYISSFKLTNLALLCSCWSAIL